MKGITLALDGSTYTSSVALFRDDELLTARETEVAADVNAGGRGEALVPLIAEILAANDVSARAIGTVICGAGPGSFTSLRIAASVGKGIAFAAGAKMYAVSSLILTVAALEPLSDGTYLSVLPAMRGELFALGVSVRAKRIETMSRAHQLLTGAALADAAAGMRASVVGPGQSIDASPHAKGVARVLDDVIAAGPVDLDSWEPDYGRLAEAQVKWESAHGRPLRA